MRLTDYFFRALQFPLIIKNQNEELIYAKVWDDTKRGLSWCDRLLSLSPGRYAVGYNYLYVMTRILNDCKPKNVLDIGLGISSSLINTYFTGMNMGGHTIVEHNKEWISFYGQSHKLHKNVEFISPEIICAKKKGYNHFQYGGFRDKVKEKKYDLISVDAPYGSRHNSRSDIVGVIPDILCDSFVIVFDDANRKGEKETIKFLEGKLSKNGISYKERIYKGNSYVAVIASSDNAFLCTL